MDLEPHRQAIAKRLSSLEAATQRLVDALAHGGFAAQVEATTGDAAIRNICDAYATIDYAMTDDVNESIVCLGVIGVNADTLKKAEAVNAAKAKFKDACTPLQGIRVRIPVKGDNGPTKAIPAIRVILRNIQRSDLNLLAAYRKIPILKVPPKTITYTRANTRSVYRKTVEEILALLNNINTPTALADRERLANLDRRITHLALVKHRYPNIRANILHARLDTKGRGRIQISAELPLIYATGARSGARSGTRNGKASELPEVHFPADNDASTTPRRKRESQLETAPFLHSLPVYRYSAR